MDTTAFKVEYPSAVIKDGTITLSQEDYDKLLIANEVSAPENVKSFYYMQHTVVVAAPSKVAAQG